MWSSFLQPQNVRALTSGMTRELGLEVFTGGARVLVWGSVPFACGGLEIPHHNPQA